MSKKTKPRDDAGEKWELNASTGNYIANITDNGRIVRDGIADGCCLYRAEFWGDYSLSFPKKGPWRKKLGVAKDDLKELSESPEHK